MSATGLHRSTPRGPTVGDARPARALHYASVVTPEAVLLEFRAAGLGSRILAKAADLFVIGLVLSFGMAAIGFLSFGSGLAASILIGLFWFVVFFGYPASEAFMSGQTLGKRMLGIRVVTTEGGPEQLRHAAVRTLIGTVEFLMLPGGALAMITALVSRRSQRIGDMAAGTIVVRLERSLAQPVFFPMVHGYEQYAQQFDSGSMTREQFAVLRDFMLRYAKLSTDAAAHLARTLADSLHRSGATPRPAQMSYEHYLMAAVFAYQKRFALAQGPSLSFVSQFLGGHDAGFTGAPPAPSPPSSPPSTSIG